MVKILRRVLESVAVHAEESLPCECCGILLAQGNDLSAVSCALPADNADRERPRQRYSLGHQAHIRAVEREASSDDRIVGYYHSHPDGGTQPSRCDTTQAVVGVIYLIIGIGGRSIEWASWRLVGNHFVRESLEVIE